MAKHWDSFLSYCSSSNTAHPAGFQAHNMPGSQMGFHPAPAQPMVSSNKSFLLNIQLTDTQPLPNSPNNLWQPRWD